MSKVKLLPAPAPTMTLDDAEPLLDDLTGAAFTAAALLEAIGENSGDPGTSTRRGLLWLSNKLSAAAENVRAIDSGRPGWATTMDAEDIARALAKAALAYDARHADRD